MINKKYTVPLWLMHAFGAAFVALCLFVTEVAKAPDWVGWLVLVVSIYVSFKLVDLMSKSHPD